MIDKSFSIARFFPLEEGTLEFFTWIQSEVKRRIKNEELVGKIDYVFKCEMQEYERNGVTSKRNLVTAIVTIKTEP